MDRHDQRHLGARGVSAERNPAVCVDNVGPEPAYLRLEASHHARVCHRRMVGAGRVGGHACRSGPPTVDQRDRYAVTGGQRVRPGGAQPHRPHLVAPQTQHPRLFKCVTFQPSRHGRQKVSDDQNSHAHGVDAHLSKLEQNEPKGLPTLPVATGVVRLDSRRLPAWNSRNIRYGTRLICRYKFL